MICGEQKIFIRSTNPAASSDVFSFGALLFRILTNQNAFRGAQPENIRASILRRFPDMRLIPQEAREVRAVLEHSLEKERAVRLQNVAEFRLPLESVRERDAQQPLGKTIANYRVLAPIHSEDRLKSYEAETVTNGEHVIFVTLPNDYVRDTWKIETFKKRLTEYATEHPAILPLREIGVEGRIAFVVLVEPQSEAPVSPVLSPYGPPARRDYRLYIDLAILGTNSSADLRFPPFPPTVFSPAPIAIIGAVIIFLAIGALVASYLSYLFFR